ncbi:MAG: hypothetical protein K2W82_17515 [Candidatus Obscuribacterales bacterium]|nr:hypothetical protein [Candidatus Obscuribacterales bacterium]
MQGKKRYVLLGVVGLVALGFLFHHLATRNSRSDDYNAVTTGTSTELIQKYAATYFAHAYVIEGHEQTLVAYDEELKKSAELEKQYAEAHRNADALVKKACLAPANEAAALFAEARAERKRGDELFGQWELGNKLRGELLKRLEHQKRAYNEACWILNEAKFVYQVVASRSPTGGAVEITTEKVLAAERDFVNDLRAKAGSRADLLDACASYDTAHKLLLEARERSKELDAVQRVTSVAFQNYDKLSAAVIDAGTAENEANCRLAYVTWQTALQAEKPVREKWQSYDSYSTYEKQYRQAFHKVLSWSRLLDQSESK